MIIMKSLEDIEALKDLEVKAIAMKQYNLCFKEFIEDPDEDFTMDRMGHLVYIETSEELTKEHKEVELLKETGYMFNFFSFGHDELFIGWEYAEKSGNVWQVLVLVNDEFGRIFLFKDNLAMPLELRKCLEEYDSE